MKILFLNYEFPPLGGGASPVSLEIARRYVARGHDVDVITMSYHDLPHFEIVDGVKVYRVPSLRSKKEICHPWEQLTYLISARRFLTARLNKVTYDINHTHFIIPTGMLSLWLKKTFDIPYVITSHGSDVLGFNKRFALIYPFLKRPWKRIIRNARCVTAPSEFLIQAIRKRADDGRFKAIANGIDLERFPPMKKLNRILIVARLFPNKGVQDVLDALKGLDLGRWRVDIVGDGPYRKDLEQKALANGLVDKVTFHGWIDNESTQMKEFYGRASIYISASHFESFGLTVLEAISADCYPLVSDIGGHRYIVSEDRFFFRKENSDDLKSKLEDLLRKGVPSRRIDIGRFSWDAVIKDYLSLLES